MSQKTWAAAAVTFALGVLSFGCQSGGIGDPCTPEDEYQQYFSGYAITEVNIESRSFQCETRLCLVNHFQGRVTCPYGQLEGQGADPPVPAAQEFQLCHIPGTTGAQNRVKVAVNRQFTNRVPTNAVYCSCRCNGPDSSARYCKCPTGFQCVELLNSIDRLGSKELAGSYCVKDNTAFDPRTSDPGKPCQVSTPDAVPPNPAGPCGAYDGQ
jgi:hypothetical protein